MRWTLIHLTYTATIIDCELVNLIYLVSHMHIVNQMYIVSTWMWMIVIKSILFDSFTLIHLLFSCSFFPFASLHIFSERRTTENRFTPDVLMCHFLFLSHSWFDLFVPLPLNNLDIWCVVIHCIIAIIIIIIMIKIISDKNGIKKRMDVYVLFDCKKITLTHWLRWYYLWRNLLNGIFLLFFPFTWVHFNSSIEIIKIQ